MAEGGLYLRPLGLLAGEAASAALAAGVARPLLGGRLGATAVERIRWAVDGLERSVLAATDPDAALPEQFSRPRPPPFDRPLVMGILNVTPDSFSDGGRHAGAAAAVAHGLALRAAGADLVDVGGESTRPGAAPVPALEELRRVVPVVEALAEAGVPVSIDTRKAAVMRAALAAGAAVLNDVSGLSHDPEALAVAAGSTAAVVLMHMAGEPSTMNDAPSYRHCALEVHDALAARVLACEAAGIARSRLVLDPGLCFGKHEPHNLDLLRHLAMFHGLGCPLLLGASRKGWTTALEAARPPDRRLPGSLVAAHWALDRGIAGLRVHDVAETRQAVDAWLALSEARPGTS